MTESKTCPRRWAIHEQDGALRDCLWMELAQVVNLHLLGEAPGPIINKSGLQEPHWREPERVCATPTGHALHMTRLPRGNLQLFWGFLMYRICGVFNFFGRYLPPKYRKGYSVSEWHFNWNSFFACSCHRRLCGVMVRIECQLGVTQGC